MIRMPMSLHTQFKNRSFLHSLEMAYQGILSNLRRERNMRIHFFIFQLLLVFDLLIQPTWWQIILGLMAAGGVFALELINCSLEAVVDLLVQHQWNTLAKAAKDAAAGAVLVFAFMAAMLAIALAFVNWPWRLNLIFHPRFLSTGLVLLTAVLSWITWFAADKQNLKNDEVWTGE
ncbi:diacylglycerol kinase family protein [Alicyclobacillus tolerans]|uniref:Diacylglycerol kinase n=3 Tax=Alicyclobacillaceae TaxID=186823 RepID=A0A1M6JWB7_9BACL|nr:Diacylglycerol kinase [Alicyclobacillus montanus]